jgi:hypothetical protein
VDRAEELGKYEDIGGPATLAGKAVAGVVDRYDPAVAFEGREVFPDLALRDADALPDARNGAAVGRRDLLPALPDEVAVDVDAA